MNLMLKIQTEKTKLPPYKHRLKLQRKPLQKDKQKSKKNRPKNKP